MWYASPFVPCWTAIARLPAFFFLKASASFSSCANVFGTLTSAVFTTSPMFSICVGTPYSFLTAVPYENALVVYAGNCAFVAALRKSGCTRPLAASWPVQSCARQDDVRGVGRGNGAEVVADLAEVVDDDVDVRAAGRGPRVRELGDCRLAVLVGPDA